MGWEKRRFNRIEVDLPVDLAQANIELILLEPIVSHCAVIEDLSASGMLVFGARQFRPGSRFRASFNLPGGPVQFFVIVKHSFEQTDRPATRFGHGMQIVGGTEHSVVALVTFIKSHGISHVKPGGHLRVI